MARSRPARRRPHRPDPGARAAGKSQPRALGAFRKIFALRKESARRTRPRGDRRRDRGGARRREQIMPLLTIDNLRVVFHGDRGRRTVAVDGVDLSVARGQTLGIVGESGSGKSVTSLAVMGLLPNSAAVTGAVTFDGVSLLDLPD